MDLILIDSINPLFFLSSHLKESRVIPIAWLQKLKLQANSFEEARLRNDFLFYLMSALENTSLDSPFDEVPPDVSVVEMKGLLVGDLTFFFNFELILII